MDANRDYSKLLELVHETYPEIELQIEPYKGRNTTAYMKKQLVADSFPDIYCTTQSWEDELLEERLIDLSQYRVSDLYNPARLNEMDVNGATYLLPFDFSVNGILCNKSLLERLGLEIPTSFVQMRDETIPHLHEAGVEVACCLLDPVGYYFQYFFNVADTGFMNTLDGRLWQKEFIAGHANANANANANESILACATYFQEWIDNKLINLEHEGQKSGDVFNHFAEGNTAFLFGLFSRFSQNDDGTGDQYVLLPYLSVDGTQNVYITQNTRCYGLNKKLTEPGNEQKLEDALHVLEALSTNDAYTAILGEISSSMCSVKEFVLPETSPYYNAMLDINAGHAAPLVYNGWESYLIPFSETVHDWIAGNGTAQTAMAALDDLQSDLMKNGTPYYTNVTEELSTEQAAVLCAQMFLDAVPEADAALISYNVYHPEVSSNLENGYGANGRILTGEMSEEDIVIFLPTGWYDHLMTAVRTGADIKQRAKDGCDLRGNGYPYPYVLMTRDGKELDDNTEYNVIFCGYPKAENDTLGLTDTGIVGLDAAKQYLSGVDELSSKTLDLDRCLNL